MTLGRKCHCDAKHQLEVDLVVARPRCAYFGDEADAVGVNNALAYAGGKSFRAVKPCLLKIRCPSVRAN